MRSCPKYISFFSLLFLALAVLLSLATSVFGLSPASLNIIVKQDKQNNLSVKEIKLEPLYPSDYKLNLPSNFYTVKILDSKSRDLFSGKVVHTKVIFPPLPTVGEAPLPPIIEQLDEIKLYLPYYQEAEKVIFLDQQDNLKLKIDLDNYDFKLSATPMPISSKHPTLMITPSPVQPLPSWMLIIAMGVSFPIILYGGYLIITKLKKRTPGGSKQVKG